MSLSVVPSRVSAQTVLAALIALNRVEDEAAQMKRPSPRIKTLVAKERKKLPVPILTHHDRMRSRGRKSTVAVRHDVCSGCHLSIAQGLRSRLRYNLDLNVCENCGSYIYLAEEEVQPAVPAPVQVRTVAAEPLLRQVRQGRQTKRVRRPVASVRKSRSRIKSVRTVKRKKRLASVR